MLRISLDKVSAVATSINPRVEKHGPEDRVIGVDIDFNTIIPADWLNKMGVDTTTDYGKMLFDKNGEIKNTGVEKLVFARVYEEHELTITMDTVSSESITLKDVTIKKISAVPEFGHKMKLHLQAQCHPQDEQYLFIHDVLLKDHVLIEVIEPPQQDMLESEDDATE